MFLISFKGGNLETGENMYWIELSDCDQDQVIYQRKMHMRIIINFKKINFLIEILWNLQNEI